MVSSFIRINPKTLLLCILSVSESYVCAQGVDLDKTPAPPDYQKFSYWVAHPDKQDLADVVPGRGQISNDQANAKVDVFFVYPTIYTGEQYSQHPWYADVNDDKLNKRIAESTIKNQATVFNGSARVYSPLYRQGHIKAFFADSTTKDHVLDFAYQDVKKAFQYYLDHWNQGRPIIIASHSQGTVHTAKLLHEFFENKSLMSKLVAAYIVGMPVPKDEFEHIPLCENEGDTGCWMTWNTYRKGYYPPNYEKWFANAASMNPINWTLDNTWASWDENLGGVLRNYKKINKGLTDAQNHKGLLWIHEPRFFGRFLINWKRYHLVDYNLFYMNIRENVKVRVSNYLSTAQNDQ